MEIEYKDIFMNSKITIKLAAVVIEKALQICNKDQEFDIYQLYSATDFLSKNTSTLIIHCLIKWDLIFPIDAPIYQINIDKIQEILGE